MKDKKSMKTAVEFWDSQWKEDKGRANWMKPEKSITQMLPFYNENGVQKVLDLGAGVGRHALYFAREGFDVDAMDGSIQGMEFLEDFCWKENLKISCLTGDFENLPMVDHSYDLVISWNVIYHGNLDTLYQAVAEIHRVLKPGGFFQGTLVSKDNHYYRVGTELDKDTWIADGEVDKNHPHCYLDENDTKTLFKDWEWIKLEKLDFGNYKDAYHWHFTVKKI